jgi:hypothetical protein
MLRKASLVYLDDARLVSLLAGRDRFRAGNPTASNYYYIFRAASNREQPIY